MQTAFNIPNIFQSLTRDHDAGKLTLRQVATELNRAGCTNFIDEDRAKMIIGRERAETHTLEVLTPMYRGFNPQIPLPPEMETVSRIAMPYVVASIQSLDSLYSRDRQPDVREWLETIRNLLLHGF